MGAIGVAHGVRARLAFEASRDTEVGELYAAVLAQQNVPYVVQKRKNRREVMWMYSGIIEDERKRTQHTKERDEKACSQKTPTGGVWTRFSIPVSTCFIFISIAKIRSLPAS